MSIARAIEKAGRYPFAGSQPEKKAYSEKLSHALAFELAALLRSDTDGLFAGTRPDEDGSVERAFLGGFGYKKVDVSYATEQNGLMLALSAKIIASEPYGKNLKNRFGDLCAEATSLHMRQPYAVLGAFFGMPVGAALDITKVRRRSTFERSIELLRSISSRSAVDGSFEKFESAIMMLFEPVGWSGEHDNVQAVLVNGKGGTGSSSYRMFDCSTGSELTEEEYLAHLRALYVERNPHLLL